MPHVSRLLVLSLSLSVCVGSLCVLVVAGVLLVSWGSSLSLIIIGEVAPVRE